LNVIKLYKIGIFYLIKKIKMYGKADCTEWTHSHSSAGSRIKLKAPCPVGGCPNSNSIITWKCEYNGHDLYIYDDGFLECEDRSEGLCGRIDKWRFDCGNHLFEYPSFPGLVNMISFMGRASADADEDFVVNLGEAVIKFRR
jgi:hypothetical protein